ncbi:MAG: hypothetical protein ACOX6V_02775 [Patescibacteria group bacterium]|jgi:hypothetical protein
MNQDLNSLIQKNPLLTLVMLLVIVVLVSVAGWKAYELILKPAKPTQVTTVTFGDGQNTVTVERNGNVTIKTPFGTFTQTWDPEKVRRFFESLDSLDFDQLTQFVGTGLAIELTMADGEKITVVVDEKTQEVGDMIQETLDEIYENEGVLPTLRPEPTLNPSSPQPSSVPSPTPTSESSEDGSNPWHGGGGPQEEDSYVCDEVEIPEGRKIIISNTICGE